MLLAQGERGTVVLLEGGSGMKLRKLQCWQLQQRVQSFRAAAAARHVIDIAHPVQSNYNINASQKLVYLRQWYPLAFLKFVFFQ